ncbi:hypothetical protein [Streptomyces sp. KL116D]|uniref:hypothetical protein n=1 Tax=Streptomyces sp. KL116D TaxID=3045152 RepID=UPI0035562EC2
MSPRTPGNKPYEIVERALELSRADGCVVIADETSTANLRWAGNALTTNGVTREPHPHRDRDRRRQGGDGDRCRVPVGGDRRRPGGAGQVRRGGRRQGRARGGRAAARLRRAALRRLTDAPAETSSAVFKDFAPALGEAFARAGAGGRELCTGSPTTS